MINPSWGVILTWTSETVSTEMIGRFKKHKLTRFFSITVITSTFPIIDPTIMITKADTWNHTSMLTKGRAEHL